MAAPTSTAERKVKIIDAGTLGIVPGVQFSDNERA
jgi:hypothetical protein